ncbi:MAG: ABC transporter ATP-binding protein [Bacteroidales bacterium]|nr:ABC transporter ATP-binding protein [Bacteroidales bacterium]
MVGDIAINVSNISKSFRIPQEKRTTIREHVVGFRKKMIYETYNALEDISFEVKKGEFLSIIGRNGSGKSTLLKLLAGIYTADHGSIAVNGEISPFLELGVGFNPELSGKDNIYLNATILGLSRFEIDRCYNKIVNFSGLNQFIHLKLKNYSSGMNVRLAFSVAIHADKEILLMDEVLAVGDANFQVKCFNVFEDFIKEGKTIILVSHDPAAVHKYSDRVIYLESGRAAFIGSANEAITKYMNTDAVKYPVDNTASDAVRNTDISTADQSKEQTDQESPVISGNLIVGNDNKVAKKVMIKNVLVCDDVGNEKQEILHGENFFIRVQYELNVELNNPVFGIIIYDQKRRALFTTNTFSEKLKTGKVRVGIVTVNFRIVNYLSAGKYSLSVTVCDKYQRIYYDWIDGVKHFNVTNNNRLMSYGGVDLPHDISITND